MVYRASLLALDLLDCRGVRSTDDDLRLFRNSAQTCRGTEAKLARIHLFQLEPSSALWSSRSGRKAGLVALRGNRRHARGRTLPSLGCSGKANHTAESNPEA